jgi:hypothetical protein
LPEIYGAQLFGYLDGSIEAPEKETTIKDKDGVEVTISNPDYARWVAQDQSILGFLVRNMAGQFSHRWWGSVHRQLYGRLSWRCFLQNLRHGWRSFAPSSTSVARRIKQVKCVRCIYLYIVVSPYVRGFPAYLHLYLYYILWPLAPREYNLSIPNMVSEPVLGFP